VLCSVKIINVFDMTASCAYCVLDLGCCRTMCMRPVWELHAPSGGQLQKLPTAISLLSNRMSGRSVSCLQKLSHMVEHLIQVSVMSITCTVKVSVIQRVHQVPLGFPVNAIRKQIPLTLHHWISSCQEHCFPVTSCQN